MDNVRQKRPIALKEHVTRHQILCFIATVNFHRNNLHLIFVVWPASITIVKTLCFSLVALKVHA